MKIIESEFVKNFFKDYPFGNFLEIGANDGEPENLNEPMWSLVELGWNGVYVEPNPVGCINLLHNLKKFNNKIRVLNAAITPNGGLQEFFISEKHPVISSLDEKWCKIHSWLKTELEWDFSIVINTVSFKEVLSHIGTDFDCISIDVENTKEFYNELIFSVDWSMFKKCSVIILEKFTENIFEDGKKIITYFESLGFNVNGESDVNIIFTRRMSMQ